MVSVDKAIIARYERGGHRFEILVDPDLAWRLKRGEEVDMDDLLASLEVYKDAKKGERVSEELLQKTFGTTDIYEIAKYIIRHGEVHLTTEQRRRMHDEVWNKIAHLIARRAVDPRTGAPHPVQRILNAMEQAKVHVDIFKTPEEQVQQVVDAIRKIIPIRMETKKVQIIVPPQYTGKVYGHLKHYKILRENWGNDGSLSVVIEIPAGMVEDLLHEVAGLTHGDVQSKILE
ncbi:MAG: ribosome maturation protein [Candidatus Diapherotrites archaeon]|nr:ribosome maturation protein [Candidatus Diapherotrites archaeon]MDN5367062.1 ribosome maturation protein [Candidatus Diapherotrites archaeon]